MSREDPQLKVRLPVDLKDHIEAAAKNNGRSMNAEIIARLESSFGTSSVSRAPAIEILKMTKTQRLAFLENIERTLRLEKGASPEHLKMLLTLRNAALQEVETIDRQISEQDGSPLK